MSFYILIRGPAGAGKSTLSERLRDIYDGHHIKIDRVKKENGLSHSELDKLKANKLVLQDADSHLSKGQVVIIDEVFYYPNQLREIIDSLSYQGYVFSLRVPLEICLERNDSRRRNTPRQTTDDAIREVYGLVSDLKYGIEIVNHGRSVDETLNEILSYLPYQ